MPRCRAIVNKKKKDKQTVRTTYSGLHVADVAEEAAHRMESVIDRNELDDFLINAMMKEQEFVAERQNMMLLSVDAYEKKQGLGSGTLGVGFDLDFSLPGQQDSASTLTSSMTDEMASILTSPLVPAKLPTDVNYASIRIPRRPAWSHEDAADTIDYRERQSFIEWRHTIAACEQQLDQSQDQERMVSSHDITPYEKNLDIWRQLFVYVWKFFSTHLFGALFSQLACCRAMPAHRPSGRCKKSIAVLLR